MGIDEDHAYMRIDGMGMGMSTKTVGFIEVMTCVG